MHDFITERKAFVEVGDATSSTFSLEVGCPQGSTLGPKVFNIYCNDLHEHVDGYLVSYADDSYVIVVGNDIEDLKEKAVLTMEKHLEWLDKNGMVCNVDKTEMMIMDGKENTTIKVRGRTIPAQTEMNVLGITFDSTLTWAKQVAKTTGKTNRMLHGLRKIRRFLDTKQTKQVITSFYFSVLYYGLEVWFHRHLRFDLKQKIRSAHYRALRVIHGNEKRDVLDTIGRRATPDEWADYSVGKFLARTIIRGKPVRLNEEILQNSYSERRQRGRLFFYDNSVRKVGRQCIKNRLRSVARQMKFDWLHSSVDSLRLKLKKSFFPYARC